MFGRRRLDARADPDAEPIDLDDFGHALLRATRVREVRSLLIERALRARPSSTAILLERRAPDGRYRQIVVEPSPPAAGDATFPARGPLTRWLRVNAEPLVLADRSAVVDCLSPEERTTLRALDAWACVPVLDGHELPAILVLVGGPSASNWGNLAALVPCGRQAAARMAQLERLEVERVRLETAARGQQLAAAGTLAAAVAHEVRNPLSTIRSSVQFVIESSASWATKSDLLAQVLGEVDRINRSVSSVLGVAKAVPSVLERIDLAPVVADALSLAGPYVDHHGLTLEPAVAAAALRVRADAGQIRQVLLNVLINACEATPRGGRVTVSTVRTRDEVVVEVMDTGRGLSAEAEARAFEPFYTTKPSGTGLGLAVCRDLLAQHGGTIRLTGRPGGGTTVLITLPADHDPWP